MVAKFDAWTNEFKLDAWNAAKKSLGSSLSDIAAETFDIQANFRGILRLLVCPRATYSEPSKAMDEVTT